MEHLFSDTTIHTLDGTNQITSIIKGDLVVEMNNVPNYFNVELENGNIDVSHKTYPDLRVSAPVEPSGDKSLMALLASPVKNMRTAHRMTREPFTKRYRAFLANFSANESRNYTVASAEWLMHTLRIATVLSDPKLIDSLETGGRDALHATAQKGNVVAMTKKFLALLFMEVDFGYVSDDVLIQMPISQVSFEPDAQLVKWALGHRIITDKQAAVAFD